MPEWALQNESAAQILAALDSLFNNMQDAVSLLEHRDGTYRYVRNNAVHQRLTGFYNIKDAALEEVVGGQLCQTLISRFEQCVNTGRSVRYEQEYAFEPGTRIWQTEAAPIFDGGRVRYLLLLSRDISELKRVQRENEMLTQRLRAMFDQHSALKVVFDSVTGEIVDVNPAICSYFGYTRAEVLGQQVYQFNLLPFELQDEKFRGGLSSEALFSAAPHRLKNGETRLLDVYASAILDGKRRLLYAILFDVTDRERYREALVQEKELLRTTLRSIGDGVVTTDNSGNITGLNPVAQELTGWDNTSALGRPFTEVFLLRNEDTKLTAENPIQTVLATGRTVGLANHTELVDRSGRCLPIADSAAPIQTESGQTSGVVMVFRDVSSEKEYSRQIEFLSYRDALTGLYNRRYMEVILRRLEAPENLPVSVVVGDINGLKITNDVFGHKAGDTLLRTVARLLLEFCGADSLTARWGGDEFVIFMPRTNLRDAEGLAQRIKDTPIPVEGNILQCSLSLGCSTRDTMDVSLHGTLREAEESMYGQKLLDGKSYRNALINTLLSTLYEKSCETEAHSKRLEAYCHDIGKMLQFSSKEINELSLLALLHDIGKVSIDPNILQKPGALTAEEWSEMKRHPEIGYRIAQATPELAVVSDFILAHHERWDGKGYPYGLSKEDIPLPCRILAVADSFDAMTNDRVYRRAMSRQDAIREIERNSGTQFDPAVARVFIELLAAHQKDGSDR